VIGEHFQGFPREARDQIVGGNAARIHHPRWQVAGTSRRAETLPFARTPSRSLTSSYIFDSGSCVKLVYRDADAPC
ncbi:MAG TPA: hypothetical protein VMR29_10975, partial [Candidatus Binatia bacterium]|nr:hypothetical protein [Candidatus Binatia bacterium]